MSEESPLKTALLKLGKRKLKEADRAALLDAMDTGKLHPIWANGWEPEWEMQGENSAKIRFDSETAQHLREMAEDTTPLFKMPPPPSPWVERVAETRDVLKTIMKAEDDTIALVLHGEAGSGKSALAMWIAEQLRFVYPAPRLHLDLRGAELQPPDADEALRHLLRALAPGMTPPTNPVEIADRYDELTGEQPFILLLDNVAGYEQVLPIIPRTPSLTIITSREPLGIKDVPEIEIGGFSEMQIIDFVRQHLGEDRLTPKEKHMLFELSDGLPRAVSLAVGWLEANAERELGTLEAELRLLMEPPSPDDEAYDTFQPAKPLDAMIDTILAIGNARTPAMLDKTRQISLMPASFDVRPAAVIWDVPLDRATERLEALTRLGFLDPDRAGNRYRMPTEIATQLERGLIGMVRDEAETRYVEFFSDVLHRAELDISDGDGIVGLSRIELEWPHIQACVNICLNRGDLAAVLIKAAPETLEERLNLNEWTELWERVRGYANDMADADLELEALGQMGRCLIELSDTHKALTCYYDQLELARAQERAGAEVDAWQDIGRIHIALDDMPTAFQAFTKAVSIARTNGDDMREIELLGDMERSLDELGQDELADAAYDRRADLMEAHGLGIPERERTAKLALGSALTGAAAYAAADDFMAEVEADALGEDFLADELGAFGELEDLPEADPTDDFIEDVAHEPAHHAPVAIDPDPVGTLLGLPPEDPPAPVPTPADDLDISDDFEADALAQLDAILAEGDSLELSDEANIPDDDALDLLDDDEDLPDLDSLSPLELDEEEGDHLLGDLPPLDDIPDLAEAEASGMDDLPPLESIPTLADAEAAGIDDLPDINNIPPLPDDDEILNTADLVFEDDPEEDSDTLELIDEDDDAITLEDDDALELLDDEEADDVLDLEDDDVLDLEDSDEALELDEDDELLLGDDDDSDDQSDFKNLVELEMLPEPAPENDPTAGANEMDDLTDMLKRILHDEDDK